MDRVRVLLQSTQGEDMNVDPAPNFTISNLKELNGNFLELLPLSIYIPVPVPIKYRKVPYESVHCGDDCAWF